MPMCSKISAYNFGSPKEKEPSKIEFGGNFELKMFIEELAVK